jgi:hypothetical protein
LGGAGGAAFGGGPFLPCWFLSFFWSSLGWACARSIRPARSAIKVPAVAATDAVTIKQVPRRRRWRMVILAPNWSLALNSFARAADGGRSGAERPNGGECARGLLKTPSAHFEAAARRMFRILHAKLGKYSNARRAKAIPGTEKTLCKPLKSLK